MTTTLVEQGRPHTFYATFVKIDGSEATLVGTPTIEVRVRSGGVTSVDMTAQAMTSINGSTYSYLYTITSAKKQVDYVAIYRATYSDGTNVVYNEPFTVASPDFFSGVKGSGLFQKTIIEKTGEQTKVIQDVKMAVEERIAELRSIVEEIKNKPQMEIPKVEIPRYESALEQIAQEIEELKAKPPIVVENKVVEFNEKDYTENLNSITDTIKNLQMQFSSVSEKVITEENLKRKLLENVNTLQDEVSNKKNEIIKLESAGVVNVAVYESKDMNDKYFVEYKFNGFHTQIHCDGNEKGIMVYSEGGKKIYGLEPYLKDILGSFGGRPFVVDGEMIPYHGEVPLGRSAAMKYLSPSDLPEAWHIKFHVFDILSLAGKDLRDLPLYDRKKYLEEMKQNETMRHVVSHLVTKDGAEEAIRKVSASDYSEGAVVKEANSKYESGDSKHWLKFRKLMEVHAVVVKVNSVSGGENARNYTIGVDVTEKEAKKLDPKKVHGDVLVLGNTFNTSVDAKVGDVLDIRCEEVWRHKTDEGIHYSMHKPHVHSELNEKETSTVADLDRMVVSRGVEVKEEDEDDSEPDQMEKLVEKGEYGAGISNLPKEVQSGFKRSIDRWRPYVIQHHYRWSSNSPGAGTIHTDFRMDDGRVLEGFTIFTPGGPRGMDTLTKDSNESIRAGLKRQEPRGWLEAEGYYEPGHPGSLRMGDKALGPGAMVIVGKGKYRTVDVTDHQVIVEIRSTSGGVNKESLRKAKKEGANVHDNSPDSLKDLNGYWNFQIAHIGGKHIILVKRLSDEAAKKHARAYAESMAEKSTLSADQIEDIKAGMDAGISPKMIAAKLGVASDTVYNYMDRFGF